MPITLLDGVLVGFTLVSAVLAMVRGFSREVLSIASWIAAAAAIVFFIALIVVTVITMKIADFIIDSRIGALDRTLGFLYGAARGILVVAVGLLFFSWLVGPNPPAWIAEAKSLPLLEGVGDWLEGLLPDDPENTILDRLKTNDDSGAQLEN